MNKAAGSVISKYIFQIKKYKIDPTKPRPTKDDFYELIKDIASNVCMWVVITVENTDKLICY